MTRPVGALFAPASVAVLGASENPSKWGYHLAAGALAGAALRPVHLVNRRGGALDGVPFVPSLAGLDADLAVIAVPAAGFLDAVDDALAAGARALIGVTAGLSPLVASTAASRARASGAVLLGPNCMGVTAASTSLRLVWGDLPPGRVGLLSQSGNLAIELGMLARRAGTGFSRFASIGDAADLGPVDLLPAVAEGADAVALYLEDVGDGRAFVAAARDLVLSGVPVSLLTAGRSAAGARAAASHTGALATDAAVLAAACREAGVMLVASPTELIESMQLAHPARRRRSAAGLVGAADLVADAVGVASGSPGVTGTADLVAVAVGVASGSPGVTGTADLVAVAAGVASGSPGVTGTADLVAVAAGVASGSPGLVGAADLVADAAGLASGSSGVAGTAVRWGGRRLGIVADGGGHGVVAADLAAAAGLEVPGFSAPLRARLAALLPVSAGTANPVDLAGAGERDLATYAAVIETVVESGEVDAVLLSGYFGGYAPDLGGEWISREGAVADAIARHGAGEVAVFVHSMAPYSVTSTRLRDGGIPVWGAVEHAVAAAAHPGPAIDEGSVRSSSTSDSHARSVAASTAPAADPASRSLVGGAVAATEPASRSLIGGAVAATDLGSRSLIGSTVPATGPRSRSLAGSTAPTSDSRVRSVAGSATPATDQGSRFVAGSTAPVSDPYFVGRALLAAAGVTFPDARAAVGPNEVAKAAADIGYPVVLKALGLAHKSDVGGVALGLADATALAVAGAGMTERLAPPGFSVEAMADVADGVEMIVGARRDPRFGPVVLVGFGGVLAEVLRDSVVELAPVTYARAVSMLGRLRGAAALRGFRGRPGIDTDALARVIVAVGDVVAAHPEIAELDVNPVVAHPAGALALDAHLAFTAPTDPAAHAPVTASTKPTPVMASTEHAPVTASTKPTSVAAPTEPALVTASGEPVPVIASSGPSPVVATEPAQVTASTGPAPVAATTGPAADRGGLPETLRRRGGSR